MDTQAKAYVLEIRFFRFSLYGFLKNQRYFEPFLFLAFLEKGLDFTDIGLLIAVRELTTNLLEIPYARRSVPRRPSRLQPTIR